MKLLVTAVVLLLALVGSSVAGVITNPPDVALAGTASASGYLQIGSPHLPGLAIDGDTSGGWVAGNASHNGTLTGWLEVNLSGVYSLQNIILTGVGTGTETYTLYVGTTDFAPGGVLGSLSGLTPLASNVTRTGAFTDTYTSGLSQVQYILFNVPTAGTDDANLAELQADTPEPATFGLIGGALLALGVYRRRKA